MSRSTILFCYFFLTRYETQEAREKTGRPLGEQLSVWSVMKDYRPKLENLFQSWFSSGRIMVRFVSIALTSFIILVGCGNRFLVESQSLDKLQYPKKSFLETLLTPMEIPSDLGTLQYPKESMFESIISRLLRGFTSISVSINALLNFRRIMEENLITDNGSRLNF